MLLFEPKHFVAQTLCQLRINHIQDAAFTEPIL